MENRPESFTAAQGKASHFFPETAGPGGGSTRRYPAVHPSIRTKSGGGSRLSLILCILSAVVLLGTAGCSDSSSDDLVLTDAFWVAFQDGDGPWQELDITQDLVFDAEELVNDPEGRFGLAMVFASAEGDAEDNDSVRTIALKTTTAEVPSIDFREFFNPGSTSLEVTLDAESLDYGSSYLYVGGEDVVPWNTDPVTLYPSTAPYDLVATLYSGGLKYPSKIFFQTFDESAQGQVETLDIAFGEFNDLSGPYTVTFNPSADETLYGSKVYLVTGSGTAAKLGEENSDETASFEYTAPAALPGGGSHVLELLIDLDDDSSIMHYQGFVTPDDLEISGTDVPYVFDGQYAADTSTGSLLPGMGWTEVDDDMDDVAAYVSIFKGEANRIDYHVMTLVTAGRVGAEDTSITTPDLSSAPGWYPLWSVPGNAEMQSAGSRAVLASGDIDDLFTSNMRMIEQAGCPRLGDGSRVTVIENWERNNSNLY